jgi:formyltetrahydrofolate deformylase
VVSYLEQILPKDAVVKLMATERQPIVIMATSETHCLGDLLIRHYSGELPAVIRAVVSNHEKLKPLVEAFGIPFHHVSHQNLERTAHEDLVGDVLAGYAPEYIVLAKYLRILSPKFVARYPNRMINIHHSFLPAFIGAKPYHQAHERGVKIIGATAHIVTDALDTGPIIAQGGHSGKSYPQRGGDGAGGARRRENRARESSQARARRAGVFARQSDDYFRVIEPHPE